MIFFQANQTSKINVIELTKVFSLRMYYDEFYDSQKLDLDQHHQHVSLEINHFVVLFWFLYDKSIVYLYF